MAHIRKKFVSILNPDTLSQFTENTKKHNMSLLKKRGYWHFKVAAPVEQSCGYTGSSQLGMCAIPPPPSIVIKAGIKKTFPCCLNEAFPTSVVYFQSWIPVLMVNNLCCFGVFLSGSGGWLASRTLLFICFFLL